MTKGLAIFVLLCAPFTLCTANDAINPSDSMQKRDGFDGMGGMQPFQMAQGPQIPMAAPQATFMQGASSNFPMSNPMGLGALGGGGMGGFGGMGGMGGGGGGQGSPYVYEVDDEDDDDESGGGLGGLGNLFSSSMMAMLPMAGLAFLGGLTFSSLSGLVLEMISGLQLNNPTGNRVNDVNPAAGNRQRRDIPEDMLYKLHQMDTFRKVLASMPNKKIYDGQLAAKYLSCSGLADEKNLCLERATCEFTNNNSTILPLHKDALSMTVTYILKNDFVPQGIKDRIRRAATFGREGAVQCETTYPCKPSKMFR